MGGLIRRALLVATLLLAASRVVAIEPQALAPGVYAWIGSVDEPTPENAGWVGNGGFLIGTDGVVMISTGSSYAIGRERIAQAERIAGKPVVLAIESQALQEFVMGAAAFAERGIPVLAQDATAKLLVARCDTCLKNLITALGPAAMAGSRVLAPTQTLTTSETRVVAGRRLMLWHPAWAATPGDLLVLDLDSGIAFAGALVSVQRIPELRDARLDGWRQALMDLRTLPIRRLVPGWGPVSDLEAIAPLRRYFDDTERQATALLEAGSSLLEAAEHSALPAFADWALYPRAHSRNLQRLYLRLEAEGVGTR